MRGSFNYHIDPDCIILYPCGTWCYGEELDSFSHMSDDYEVVPYGTPKYAAIEAGEDH